MGAEREEKTCGKWGPGLESIYGVYTLYMGRLLNPLHHYRCACMEIFLTKKTCRNVYIFTKSVFLTSVSDKFFMGDMASLCFSGSEVNANQKIRLKKQPVVFLICLTRLIQNEIQTLF
ncbi:hypothetical protein ILYODFUR_022668 [Ilyodon furcidens]|uniref:Uncharacterized protein n=1 Tax=Ilyodon furcidens TaxID=33524 RepID=A0ABV0UBG1_9TELE